MKQGISYWNGIKVSKAVLNNYKNNFAIVNDEALIKHLVRQNPQIDEKLALEGTFENWLRKEIKYANIKGLSREQKLKVIGESMRAVAGFWKEDSDSSYIASLSETFGQWSSNNPSKRALLKKYGTFDLGEGQYNQETGGFEVVTKSGSIISFWINAHNKGEYEEEAITWTIKS